MNLQPTSLLILAIALTPTGCSKPEEGSAAAGTTGVSKSSMETPIDLGETSIHTTPAGLRLEVPITWATVEVTSSMRQGQFTLPKEAADATPPELVIYYFGEGGAGGVDANMARWAKQYSFPEGVDPLSKAKIDREVLGDHTVHTFDLSGHFQTETVPGSGVQLNEDNWRTYAAIVETTSGDFFLKTTGPAASVAAQVPTIRAVLATITLAP